MGRLHRASEQERAAFYSRFARGSLIRSLTSLPPLGGSRRGALILHFEFLIFNFPSSPSPPPTGEGRGGAPHAVSLPLKRHRGRGRPRTQPRRQTKMECQYHTSTGDVGVLARDKQQWNVNITHQQGTWASSPATNNDGTSISLINGGRGRPRPRKILHSSLFTLHS